MYLRFKKNPILFNKQSEMGFKNGYYFFKHTISFREDKDEYNWVSLDKEFLRLNDKSYALLHIKDDDIRGLLAKEVLQYENSFTITED